MIDMTTEMKNCAPVCRNHFHGNGSCDAMRDANKRADHSAAAVAGVTGMESEIAPYQNVSAATGYDNPQYGLQHDWTPAEEEGMNSAPQDAVTAPLIA